jgi:hypothetical protein
MIAEASKRQYEKPSIVKSLVRLQAVTALQRPTGPIEGDNGASG